MRILHISDWQGCFSLVPRILRSEDYDIVIASGDMIPNGYQTWELDKKYQINWLKQNKETYEELIGDRQFLYCEGNHDFVDPCEILGGENITNKSIEINGLKIHGFPYIPYIVGRWNHELQGPEMQMAVDRIPDCDILVCHCPLAGFLDMVTPTWRGNTILTSKYMYGREMPKVILCGHHHDTYGMMDFDGTIISNAATSYNIIEI